MATVNLGSIKFNWRNAYDNSTAYSVDDVVSYLGSSYICIAASTGNLPTNASFWSQMSSKGTDADLLNIASTAQGDLYFNNGSAIARLAAGTSGFYLETKGAGQNPVWSQVTAKFIKAEKFHNTTRTAIGTGSSDIALWTWGNFNKQSATSKLYYHGYCHGAETENDVSFVKFTATDSASTAETDNHGLTHGAHSTSVNAQMVNLTGKFDTAFATGNVSLAMVLSSDGNANRGKGGDGMIWNPNNSDDSRYPATSPGSFLIVYEIED